MSFFTASRTGSCLASNSLGSPVRMGLAGTVLAPNSLHSHRRSARHHSCSQGQRLR